MQLQINISDIENIFLKVLFNENKDIPYFLIFYYFYNYLRSASNIF